MIIILRRIRTYKEWYYVYIIKVTSLDGRPCYYKNKELFYVGITLDLGLRIYEHYSKTGACNGFLNSIQNAKKELVYVEYVFGNEFEVMKYERKLKNKSFKDKKELVNNDSNMLIKYIPDKKAILLKKNGYSDEIIKVLMRVRG